MHQGSFSEDSSFKQHKYSSLPLTEWIYSPAFLINSSLAISYIKLPSLLNMAWPYDQQWEDTRIYAYGLDDPAQSFSHLAPDLAWSASTEVQRSMPSDIPVSSYLSPRTRVNPLAMQGTSTGVMQTSIRHQQSASNPGIAAQPNPSQEPAVIPRGRNNTRSRAKRRQISG